MWLALRTFLSGRIWWVFAGLAVVICAAVIWDAGKDAEKAKTAKAIQKSVKVSNAIQDRNRRSSDSDIFTRLLRWQRD